MGFASIHKIHVEVPDNLNEMSGTPLLPEGGHHPNINVALPSISVSKVFQKFQ